LGKEEHIGWGMFAQKVIISYVTPEEILASEVSSKLNSE
jgi:hypothetical protein